MKRRPQQRHLASLVVYGVISGALLLVAACGPGTSPPVDIQITIEGIDPAVQAVHAHLTGKDTGDERCSLKCDPLDPVKRSMTCSCSNLFQSEYALEVTTLDDVLESSCYLGHIREPIDLTALDTPPTPSGRQQYFKTVTVPPLPGGAMCCLRLNVVQSGGGNVELYIDVQRQVPPGPACIEPPSQSFYRATQFARGTQLNVQAVESPGMWQLQSIKSKYGSGCVATTDPHVCRLKLDRSTEIDVSFNGP